MVVSNNSPQSQNMSGSYGVPKRIKRRVDLTNPGGGTVPVTGSATVANTPTLTDISGSNSNVSDSTGTTYGRKDNKYSGVGQTANISTASSGGVSTPVSNGSVITTPNLTTPNLTPITANTSKATTPQLTEIAPLTTEQGLSQVSGQPTLQDFINEAQKLGQAQVQGLIDPNFEKDLARQLYGQNVGMSGAGQQVVGNALRNELTPIMNNIGLQLGQDTLNKLYQERENAQKIEQQQIADQFSLVESGQLTGEQAIEALKKKGINPENYMTPEQVVQQKEDTQLQKLLEQVKDPNERALINDIDEFNYYMQNGRTYEDEMANILRTKKDIKEWTEKLPQIRQTISRLTLQIQKETAKGTGFFGIGGKDNNRIGQWTTQLNALKEIVSDVEAGKNPIYDINTTSV
jgi:hypothetical protein